MTPSRTPRWSLLAACVVACGLGPWTVPGALAAPGDRVEPASTVRVRLLSPGTQPATGVSHRPAIPFRTLDPAAVAEAKRAAASRGAAFRAPLSTGTLDVGPSPDSAISPGLNDPGLSATDNTSQTTPSDSTGAIGPGSYIEMVNTKVGLFSRSDLTKSASVDLDTFTGVASSFDPQIQYDPESGRWYYLTGACGDAKCTKNNSLAFGWSKSSDPAKPTLASTDWCRYQLSTGSDSDDYPKLGHSNGYLVFGSNVFSPAFVTARIWAVPKGDSTCPAETATGYGSSKSPLTTLDSGTAFTPVPANTFDSNANAYIVAADLPGAGGTKQNQIMSWHVDSTGALVQDGNTDVAAYAVPGDVPQPGTSNTLDSQDTRLTQAVGLGGAVWTQHTIDGTGGRSVVRWYKVTPGAAAPSETGTIANGADYVFNGAISPAANGSDAVIDYNVGSASRLAEVRAQFRTAANTMGNELTLAASGGIDNDFTCPSCRWGDYAAATPDPVNTSVVWGTNAYNGLPSGTNARWLTRNFSLDPSAATIASPGATTNAASNLTTTSATLNAAINPNSQSTTYHFDYGTTAGYGSQTANGGPISGSGDQAVSINVSGLSPNTTYHFRVVAESAGGVTTGSDLTFKTPSSSPSPPTVTTDPATGVTDTAATLNGKVNPNGQSTTYHFEYGQTTSYGTPTSNVPISGNTTQSVSANVSGLMPGTTYHFRLVAGSTNGGDQSFTTTSSSGGGGGGGGGGGSGGGGTGTTTTTTTTTTPTSSPTPLPTLTTSPTPAATTDTVRPAFLSLSLSPTSFHAARAGASVRAAIATGTRVSFSLSERATVGIRVERAAPGRRVGGRCRPVTASNRSAPRCTRYVLLAGQLSRAGQSGPNAFRFMGRWGGRALRLGRYRLVLTATDPAGNRSLARRIAFRIV